MRKCVSTLKPSSPATGSRECAPDDRLRRVIQYSRDINDEPRSHGVLDTRFRGYDDLLWSGSVHAPTLVIPGLDPGIHPSSQDVYSKKSDA
jgi:hypothetical protein